MSNPTAAATDAALSVVSQTSTEYAGKIAIGLEDGWRHKFGNTVLSQREVIVEVRSSVLSRWRDLGDKDLAVLFVTPQPLHTLFPVGSVNIRPVAAEGLMIDSAILEIKRSCSSKHARSKLKQFISYYDALFGGSVFRDKRYSKKNDAPPHERSAFLQSAAFTAQEENRGAPLCPVIFLFNGSDLANIWNMLQAEIAKFYKRPSIDPRNTAIRGHEVVCIHCIAERLILWESLMVKDEAHTALAAAHAVEIATRDATIAQNGLDIAARDAVITQNDLDIAALEAVIAQKGLDIAARDKIISDKDAQIADKDFILGQIDTIIGQKDAIIDQKDLIIAQKDNLIADRVAVIAEKNARIAELMSFSS